MAEPVRLSLEAVWQERDHSFAGQTFSDHAGMTRTIRYTVRSVFGYGIHITGEAIDHITADHPEVDLREAAWVLNNPNIVLPDADFAAGTLYYRQMRNRYLVVVVHLINDIRNVVTAHLASYLKGLASGRLTGADVLYIEGGFKWRQKLRIKT